MIILDGTCAVCKANGIDTPIRYECGMPRWCTKHYSEHSQRVQLQTEVLKNESASASTETRPASTNTVHHKRPTIILVPLLFVCLVAMVLVACDGGPTTYQDPSPLPVVHVKHRSFVNIAACVNTTATYPASLAHQALGLITSSVNAMLQSNWDGANIYVTLLDADPTNANATVALHIPAISDYPSSPGVQPTPTTNPNNPYASAPKQATVSATNASAISGYNQQVQAVEQQLSSIQTTIANWRQNLTHMHPPTGVGQADLDQCIELASHRFNTYHGEKWLVIASSLPLPGGVSSWYPLTGVHVRWIYTTCPNISSCQAGENAWAQVLTAAGVGWHDHLWYDVGESQTLSALFGTPVANS